MPCAPRTFRAPRTRWSPAAAVLAVLLGTTGCQSIGSGAHLVDRAGLLNALASRLERSGELTYSADYRLAGGGTTTLVQAQRPRRAAYLYPGGKVTVTAEATTACRTTPRSPTCVLSPSPADSGPPTTALITAAEAPRMVAPATVVHLLSAAARNTEATLEQHDTTVAGRHATCVEAPGAASAFTACITTEGVLGSFTGTVDGRAVDVTMTRYRDDVDPVAFALPRGATVVDSRPDGG